MFTTITVTMLMTMIALLVAIIAGHFSGREPNKGITDALVFSLLVIPIGLVILSLPLYNLVILSDWPNSPFVLPPQTAIWTASLLGGFLGFQSGMIWNRDGASCFHFIASIASVLVLLTLVVVLIL